MFDSKKESEFEKSKTAQQAVPSSIANITVRTIPEEFYNGKMGNGMGGIVSGVQEQKITQGEVKKVPIPTQSQQNSANQGNEATTGSQISLVKPSSVNPTLIAVSVVILLMMLGGGGYVYYTYFFKKPVILVKQPIENIVVPPIDEVIQVENTIETTTSTPSLQTITKSFPLGLREYSKALDSDNDSLTDSEETEIYKSTFDKPDTDEDGYLDGLEVLNLYNPAGFKPVKLVETENFTTVTNPVFGYSVLSPKTFVEGKVDTDGKEMFFTANSGENFIITVRPNKEKIPLRTWYETNAPQVVGEQVREIITKQGLKGLLSPDQLALYIAREDVVYEIRYDLGLATQAKYLQTFFMFQNSLIFTNKPQYVPTETPFAPPSQVEFEVIPPIDEPTTPLTPADALLQNSNPETATSTQLSGEVTSSTPITPAL